MLNRSEIGSTNQSSTRRDDFDPLNVYMVIFCYIFNIFTISCYIILDYIMLLVCIIV